MSAGLASPAAWSPILVGCSLTPRQNTTNATYLFDLASAVGSSADPRRGVVEAPRSGSGGLAGHGHRCPAGRVPSWETWNLPLRWDARGRPIWGCVINDQPEDQDEGTTPPPPGASSGGDEYDDPWEGFVLDSSVFRSAGGKDGS